MPKESVKLLEYDAPALDWERQALPIGNGRLGAMVLGSPNAAHFQLNVDSLWTGGENPSGEYDHDHFGDYQPLGDLFLELDRTGPITQYRRSLDLEQALHVTEFLAGDGTIYRQEAFASYPAELIVVRVSASGPSRLRGRLRLVGTHDEATVDTATASASGLGFGGALGNGLEYAAKLFATGEDCTPLAAEGAIRFDNCKSLLVLLAAATNYAMDPNRNWRAPKIQPVLSESLAQGLAKGFEQLLAEHTTDHSALFGRVDLDLGGTANDIRSKPLDERIAHYAAPNDPELATKLFHYGRYLLIASSRDNGVPANLQGLWNQSPTPPWHSDYHTNINTQMNYWLAEPTNLAECHLPLFHLLDAMLPKCRAATRAEFGTDTRGFTYRTSHNIFGGMGWEWNTTANAWYALHYFEHYAFSGDRSFLENRAWPYLREASEFWLSRLKRRSDGALVAPDGWSPEHGPREDGVSYDQQLIGELFASTLAAADVLGREHDALVQDVAAAQTLLLGPRVGSWGQLQEWVEDRDDPNDRHRHTSHLVGVYPGRTINRTSTPALARAAEVSLRARGDTGDSRRSWTWPWRCALWARLGTHECHRMIDGLIQHNLLPNLITTHPPLQLDGNFGMSAGIAEMLLQSHAGQLQLLPGVDRKRWPRGSFRGLRARGGFVVSAHWNERGLVDGTVESTRGGPVTIQSQPVVVRAATVDGRMVRLVQHGPLAVGFDTLPRQTYRLEFAAPPDPPPPGHY